MAPGKRVGKQIGRGLWKRADKICFTNAKKKVQCYPANGGGGGGGAGRRRTKKKFQPMKLNRTAGNYSRVPKHKRLQGSKKRKSYKAPSLQTDFNNSSNWGVQERE